MLIIPSKLTNIKHYNKYQSPSFVIAKVFTIKREIQSFIWSPLYSL